MNIVRRRKGHLIVAKVPGFPQSWRSWGELVTVRFHDGYVLVNSICDPEEGH